MLRFVLAIFLLASPLMAEEREDLCRVSSEIAGRAVVERAAGEEQDQTVAAITADLEGEDAAYATAVTLIVHWVYTLPEEQLTEEVAPAYEEACLAY